MRSVFDIQSEVGQDPAGLDKTSFFIKADFTAAGGTIIVHQPCSVILIIHRSRCDQIKVIIFIDSPFVSGDLKNLSFGVSLIALIELPHIKNIDRSGIVYEMELTVRIEAEADDQLTFRRITIS